MFKIPEELQNANLHEQLIATNAFKKVKNSLKKRHHERNIWIKLTKEIKETYVTMVWFSRLFRPFENGEFTAVKIKGIFFPLKNF